jgi:hypothetical protein
LGRATQVREMVPQVMTRMVPQQFMAPKNITVEKTIQVHICLQLGILIHNTSGCEYLSTWTVFSTVPRNIKVNWRSAVVIHDLQQGYGGFKITNVVLVFLKRVLRIPLGTLYVSGVLCSYLCSPSTPCVCVASLGRGFGLLVGPRVGRVGWVGLCFVLACDTPQVPRVQHVKVNWVRPGVVVHESQQVTMPM